MVVEQPAGGMNVELARKTFIASAERFTREQVSFEDGRVWREAGLYVAVRQLLVSAGKKLGSAVPASRTPASIACLSWLKTVDEGVAEGVAELAPDCGARGTVAALEALIGADYGPSQTGRLLSFSRRLDAWASSAADLLGLKPLVVPLRKKCPQCGSLFHYRVQDGEAAPVRGWALTVSGETGTAGCSDCGSRWENLQWLAQLIDAGEPAGATA